MNLPLKKKQFYLLSFILSFVLVFSRLMSADTSYAALTTCGVTVSPTEVLPSSQNNFQFNFSNNVTSSSDIKWIKITKPFAGLTTDGSSLFQWVKTFTSGGTTVVITDESGVNPLEPSGSINLNLTISAGEISGSSGDWIVEASDSTSGTNPITCTGTTSLSVSGTAPDTEAPVISSISVSDITSSTAKVSWTTDESSDSLVEYTVVANFGEYQFSGSSSSLVTSHSVTLSSNIAANTTYYYRVCSTDESDNQSCSNENSFTSSASTTTTTTAAPTATAAPTTAPTSAAVATATPTPTPFVDRVAPNIEITTEIEDAYEQAPLIEGEASDSIGVTEVEFSIDGGANWLPVDELSEDLPATSVEFGFTANIFEDGNYDILTRALDEEGNIGESETVTIIIDRLPPRVGGNLVSLGPLPLHPNQDGSIVTIPGLAQRITLSTVGGATSVDLFINESISSLGFNAQTGLWNGALNLQTPGRYKLRTRAIDGADNVTERDLNDVLVVAPGAVYSPESEKLVEKGTVTVYVQDTLTKFWSIWDGKTFGQENPQNLIEGRYSFFLPPGTYYLTVTDTGSPKLTSKIFQVNSARVFVPDFTLQERRSLKIGPISIPLPDMFQEKADVTFKSFSTGRATDPLIGIQVPRFSLPGTGEGVSTNDLQGQRSMISFINTWSPPAIEQVPLLDQYFRENAVAHAIVAIEETIPRITVFSRRGRYESEILSDRDGELVEDFAITSLPKHLFLDRQGIVRNVVYGVLNSEEIEAYLSEI